jgi:hypothetical protein
MKTTFIIFFGLLFGFESLFSQNSIDVKNQIDIEKININKEKLTDITPKVIPIYFVLGTLSDYMGRFHYVERNKQVDKYNSSEKSMVDYLTEYIKNELNITVDTSTEKSKIRKMYSNKLSMTLNSFYGKEDELIDSLFKTNEQVYSFLTGVYFRYGDKLDTSIYKIQIANSPKHQTCYDFLKKIGCSRIFYKYIGNIPAQYILYFEPTVELKKYFDWIEHERLILKESFHNQIKAIFKEQTRKDEIERAIRKSKDDELENIKNAFK